MFSLFTAGILLLELPIYVWLATLLAGLAGWGWLAVVPLTVTLAVLVRLVMTSVSFLFARGYGSPRPDSLHPGIGGLAWMLLFETLCGLWLFSVLAPLERWLVREPPRSRTGEGKQRIAVLMVHGFFCNGACWWACRRALAEAGFTRSHTINLEPLFCPIERYTEPLAQAVERIVTEDDPRALVIVAHSMGGLVARNYLASDAVSDKVRRVVTLGTPHHGTRAGAFSPAVNARQMRPASSFMAAMAGRGTQGVSITSVYSYDDNIVVPQTSARLEAQRNIALAGLGHVGLLFSGRVHGILAGELAETEAALEAPASDPSAAR